MVLRHQEKVDESQFIHSSDSTTSDEMLQNEIIS